MVMGVLFAHKKYPLAKYFCVVLISLGVALVVYKDSKAAKGADSDRSFGVGELLLVRHDPICVSVYEKRMCYLVKLLQLHT